jgi:hypothetical protein
MRSKLQRRGRREEYECDRDLGGYLIVGGSIKYHTKILLPCSKHSFLRRASEELDLSPTFEDFSDWLEDLRLSFRGGLLSKLNHDCSVYQQKRRNGHSGGGVIPV